MPIQKNKGFNPFDRHDNHNDNGPDFSNFGGFLNSILQHNSHNPPPPAHNPPPGPTLQFRSIDGSGNDIADPNTNKTGTPMIRVPGAEAHFDGDGQTPLDTGINPRDVSNIVVGQGDADVPNAEGLSGMMYAWGQFIDHDLDLIKSGTDPFNITIPVSAQDPAGGQIDINRAAFAPGTGNDAAHPATAVNTVTGWLDASMVYGSDAATAASLRLPDGHMKTSVGNNLPIDPNSGMFMAGDVRAAENPDLTALQTLFVREHNYQVDLAHQQHPNWNGDQLYQYARAVVAAEIEHITFDEFLPHLLGAGAIDPYQGYDATVDPTITEEFAGAAYRFGHSIVSLDIEKIGEQGQELAEGESLKDVFFQPAADFLPGDGADALLRALSSDRSRAMDVRIVDDLRNFLSDPPDLMDLAAINIQRGHDLGLGTLNETRAALGLPVYHDMGEITTDADTVAAMRIAFQDNVDLVDLWTGGLAESHVPGGMIGETFAAVIGDQFEALRDGDRLWYENQGFDAKTLAAIKNTSLGDIIERNTDTNHIQDDVFVFYNRHSGTQLGVESEEPNAPQLVVGSKGFDTLVGGPQGDLLVANTGGLQTMTGGTGGDQFIVNHNMNVKITDFKPGTDKIVFDDAGSLNFHDVHIKADHNNTVVEAGGNHIVLLNVNPLQLHASDFIYHG